jgi:hypothetical protein
MLPVACVVVVPGHLPPGQLANSETPANQLAPGAIQSQQNTIQLGQLKDCVECGGGFWGSMPGNELHSVTNSVP